MKDSVKTPVTPNATKSNWYVQKGKLKAKFPSLTDADLHFEEGKKDEMLSRVQNKLGKSKEELTQIISAL